MGFRRASFSCEIPASGQVHARCALEHVSCSSPPGLLCKRWVAWPERLVSDHGPFVEFFRSLHDSGLKDCSLYSSQTPFPKFNQGNDHVTQLSLGNAELSFAS